MQRIDSPAGQFVEGNPATGVKGTKVTAVWLNALQESVIALDGDIQPVTADYTLLETDRGVLIDTTIGPVTISLPVYASVAARKEFRYKWFAGDNPATITCIDGKTIDAAASIVIGAPGDRGLIIKAGDNWQTF